MKGMIYRRTFLKWSGSVVGLSAAGTGLLSAARVSAAPQAGQGQRIYKSIKMGMFDEPIPLLEKFRLMREMGFDGAELNSPGGENKEEAFKASRELGFPIHGTVDSIHWGTRLSDPDAAVREKGLQGLRTALRDTAYMGGNAVLLVPGKVSNAETENQDQVWSRSIEQIRLAIPEAARLGVRILIENVWNGFCYDPAGGESQTADKLASYLDEIASPWVGSYFDIGNHQRFAKPANWIRRLGPRIVKLDVKDWGKKNGFCKIGEGDVDWADVRAALREIGFSGWATAEVAGGNRDRIREISQQMDKYLLGKS